MIALMRFELVSGESTVLVRMHAFMHKATSSTNRVSGWFEVESDADVLRGPTSGDASADVADFDFRNVLQAVTARRWIKERDSSTLRFLLRSATGTESAVVIGGELAIGDVSRSIEADATIIHDGSRLVVAGTWELSQHDFGLVAPPGVRDEVDVEFGSSLRRRPPDRHRPIERPARPLAQATWAGNACSTERSSPSSLRLIRCRALSIDFVWRPRATPISW